MKLIYLMLIVVLLFSSCFFDKKIRCEGFDFKRIPYKKEYFLKNLYYTNGGDTIQLNCVRHTFSRPFSFKESDQFLVECRPSFEISYADKNDKLHLDYIFIYSPLEENIIELSLYINFSKRRFLLSQFKGTGEHRFNLGKKYNLAANIADEEIIDQIKIKEYRITYIEKESGENWKLIQVGD